MDRRHYVDIVRIDINVHTSFFSGYTSKPILMIRIVFQGWNMRAEAEPEITETHRRITVRAVLFKPPRWPNRFWLRMS